MQRPDLSTLILWQTNYDINIGVSIGPKSDRDRRNLQSYLIYEKVLELKCNRFYCFTKEDRKLADMKELKEKMEKMTVTVGVKVGANGKLFGSVSTKEICDKYKEQNGIELDKRRIILDEPIDALGTYKVSIQLHKEVIGTIILYVVEEGAK